MNKPTILISTFGNYELGTGHVFRDLELAKSLRPHIRIIFNPNNSQKIIDMIRRNNFRDIYLGNLNKALETVQPHVLLYDYPSYFGPISPLVNIKNSLKILALDYYYPDKRIDCTINLRNYSPSRNYGFKQHLFGFQYAIVKREILDYGEKNQPNLQKVRNLLITFGGTDPQNNTLKIMEILNKINIDQLTIKVIIGPFFKQKNKIIQIGRSFFKNHFIYIYNTNEIGYHMAEADIIFCSAGTTLLESLYLGKPVVVLPQSQEEINFVNRTRLKKSVLLITDNLETENKVSYISTIINNYSLRQKLVQDSRQLIDGKGVKRISQIIIKMLKDI